MKCDCCGKRKRLFESYAHIVDNKLEIDLCVKCNDLMYKLRDAYNDNNKDEYEKIFLRIVNKEKKSTKKYIEWRNQFIKKLEKKGKSKATE